MRHQTSDIRHQAGQANPQVSSLLSHVSSLRIGVIGSGTMGQALIRGLIAQGVAARAIMASDASAVTRRLVRQRFRIAATSDNIEVVTRCQVVLLAVKPQQMAEVIGWIAPHLSRRHLVISIAAGMTLRWLQARLPGVPIVRVMPNLPATVGCGFAAVTFGRGVRASHRKIAQAIFSAVGEVVELPQLHFDAITAVSGSGPAYIFFLVEAWERAAQALGVPRRVAHRAIRSTLEGGVRLLNASDVPAQELIARVASKGGTTEAALRVLAKRRVAAHFIEALRAAARRSRQLSR